MTAIAYRNGVMAADTQSVYGEFKVNENKIIQRDGFLIGSSGSECPSMADIAKWFLAGVGKSSRPEFKGANFHILVATPQRQLQIWTHMGLCDPIRKPFWAIGAGAAVCMGAMEMGATAPKAVAAAIKWAEGCGGRVTVRKL